LIVADGPGRRLLRFDSAGRFIRMGSSPRLVPPIAIAFGSVAGATGGDSLLARWVLPIGRVLTLGALTNNSAETYRTALLARELDQGRVPRSAANGIIPVLVSGNELRLLLQDLPRIQAFDSSGALLWERDYQLAEFSAIRRAFETRYREGFRTRVFPAFRLLSDAQACGDALVALVNRGPDDASRLLVFDRAGRLRDRIELRDVLGARTFALDVARRRVFLALIEEASIVEASLPAEVRLTC
jgi:hypothetical protein